MSLAGRRRPATPAADGATRHRRLARRRPCSLGHRSWLFSWPGSWRCRPSAASTSSTTPTAPPPSPAASGCDPVNATRGTGAFLAVPADIVEAAAARVQGPAVHRRTPTASASATGDGMVVVASGAGRYNPLFYAVVGTAALPFDGYAALYVMRIATALCCAALRRGSRRWSLLDLGAEPVAVPRPRRGLHPGALYSTAIVAPNGVEMMAALALWMSLIGLLRALPTHPAARHRCRGLGRRAGHAALARPAVVPAHRRRGARRGPVASQGRIRASSSRRPAVAGGRPAVRAGQRVAEHARGSSPCDALEARSSRGRSDTSLGSRLGVAADAAARLWMLQSIAAFPLATSHATPPSTPATWCLFADRRRPRPALRYARGRLAIALRHGASSLLSSRSSSTVHDLGQVSGSPGRAATALPRRHRDRAPRCLRAGPLAAPTCARSDAAGDCCCCSCVAQTVERRRTPCALEIVP